MYGFKRCTVSSKVPVPTIVLAQHYLTFKERKHSYVQSNKQNTTHQTHQSTHRLVSGSYTQCTYLCLPICFIHCHNFDSVLDRSEESHHSYTTHSPHIAVQVRQGRCCFPGLLRSILCTHPTRSVAPKPLPPGALRVQSSRIRV